MAATNIASTGIVLEALTKDNYDNWSTLVKNYLVGKGLWDGIIELGPGLPKLDGEKEDDPISKNSTALHVIQLACGSQNLSNIRTFEDAREAWNHLNISFSDDVTAYPEEQEVEIVKYVPKVEGEIKSLDKSEAENKSRAKSDAQVESQTKSEAQIESQAKTEAEIKFQAKSEAEIEPQAKFQAETNSQAKTETEAEIKSQTNSEAKTSSQAKSETETKSQVKSEAETKAQAEDINKLHRDVKKGYWDRVKSCINRDKDATLSTTTTMKRTILHAAVASGRARVVKAVVELGNEELLKMQDKRGCTALALAAEVTDSKAVAQCMVDNGGKELLTTKTFDDGNHKGEIPLLIAAAKGHKEMTKYLFSKTPLDVLFQGKDKYNYGAVLLTRCISAEIFDIAVSFLQGWGPIDLSHESKEMRPINALAHMPSAFRSGTRLRWWQRCIYPFMSIQRPINLHSITIVAKDDTNTTPNLSATHPSGTLFKVLSIFFKPICQRFRQFNAVQITPLLRKLGCEKIYQKKLKNHLVLEILEHLKDTVSKLEDPNALSNSSAYDSMLLAAKYGIVEFINSMREANPELLWAMDKNKRGIFSHAITYRKEKVFQIMHEIEEQREKIVLHEDVLSNNMLHLAAELGPPSYLTSISNPALQMQRELHWFKAVKRIVPSKFKEARNIDGKKPHELFTKTHQELMKAGENWARNTATSFTIVGTLIITMMFAAAITVPGGNDQTAGTPIFLKKSAFTVFIIADAISLVMSSSSVLTFIGILTSRYAEKDFLWSLPFKLLFGLVTLFFSVTSMMISFVAALSMMLKGYRGVVITAMVLAVIPILVLIPTLLSLSFEIVASLRWRSGFLSSKKKKSHQD